MISGWFLFPLIIGSILTAVTAICTYMTDNKVHWYLVFLIMFLTLFMSGGVLYTEYMDNSQVTTKEFRNTERIRLEKEYSSCYRSCTDSCSAKIFSERKKQ